LRRKSKNKAPKNNASWDLPATNPQTKQTNCLFVGLTKINVAKCSSLPTGHKRTMAWAWNKLSKIFEKYIFTVFLHFKKTKISYFLIVIVWGLPNGFRNSSEAFI
jgi:hypothetical protein